MSSTATGTDITTTRDAYAVLQAVGAPPRLLQNARLGSEAGELLLAKLGRMGITVDATLVRAGTVLHDAGKAVHVEELDTPGTRHEPAGEALLLAHGVDARIARLCRCQARATAQDCSLEELLVMLADKLSHGARDASLEQRVVDAVAARVGRDRAEMFQELDHAFQRVAGSAESRISRVRG